MRTSLAVMTMMGLITCPAVAQTYYAANVRPGSGHAMGQSSVAYDQPIYYIARLRPSRNYPPNRYGYIESYGGMPASALRIPVR